MDGLIQEFQVDKLHVQVYETPQQMGAAAGAFYLQKLQGVLAAQAGARAVFAAAHSQDQFLATLNEADDALFQRMVAFHMDEYLGLAPEAPQRFGTFLQRAIFSHKPFRQVHLIDASATDAGAECDRYSTLLQEAPIDIVSLGFGENGHIAFNDPHEARFDDPAQVKVVTLDNMCRQQQVHDGEFAHIDLVPQKALTLTIPALMACRIVVGIVPHRPKAQAVHDALRGPITELCPASILRTHPDATLFIDRASASLL